MKANRLVNYGLVFSLGLANLTPVVYSQENKFRDYKDGDPVVMIHTDTADTNKVGNNSLRKYIKNIGGAESVVSTPKTIIKTNTIYIKEKTPQPIKSISKKSLEAKTQKHWYSDIYNNRWFQILAPTIILTGAYAIYNNNNKSDNEKTEQVYGGRKGESDAGGVRGGRTDESDAGGNR